MPTYKTHRLTLASIAYSGDDLGTDWKLSLQVGGSPVTLQTRLKRDAVTEVGLAVLERKLESGLRKGAPIEFAVSAASTGRAPAVGHSGSTLAWSGKARRVELVVQGRGSAEGKRATLTLTFQAGRIPDEAGGKPAAGTRRMMLAGVETSGDSIGRQLRFMVAVEGGPSVEFSPDLRKGYAEVGVPVYYSSSGVEAAPDKVGVFICVVEDDPKYDDAGSGTGTLDLSVEGPQTIAVPVAASGGDKGRSATFLFRFSAEPVKPDDGAEGHHPPAQPGPDEKPPREPHGRIDWPVIAIECKTELVGPKCVCIDGSYQYKVVSNCEGTCKDWKLVDKIGDPSTVARITNVQNCTATVLILKHGVFTVQVTYEFKSGGTIQLTKEVDAHGVFHVLGGTKDSVVSTVPLVQPHPFLEIKKPKETDEEECLSKGSDFRIHEKKLADAFDLLHDSDPAKRVTLERLTREHLELELLVSGDIRDFFEETNACGWIVESDGGRRITQGRLVKKEEFDDTWFRTKLPGEDKVNDRVVVLKGMGHHEVRVWAENAIDRHGTDWVTVTIGFREDLQRELARRQRHLAGLLTTVAPPGSLAAHMARIVAAVRAVEGAFWDCLVDPCVQSAYNHQVTPTFSLTIPEKTRTQGRYSREDGPKFMPAKVWTTFESKDQELKEAVKRIYVTEKSVKQYWVTQENYNGKRFRWDKDGILRGKRATPLTSKFVCCERPNPIFGVELDVPECARIRDENETVTLRAKGEPVQVDGVPGNYRWTVVAKPDEDAQVEITPSGWIPSPTAELKTDTPGRCTVKVEYELGGRTCGLTYAVADVRVVIGLPKTLTWKVERAGPYGAKLKEHAPLPIYQERTGRPVRAADMLIVAAGDAGTLPPPPPPHHGPTVAVAVSTPSTPKGPIGRRFQGSFVIPRELEFEDGMFLRAYYKPYRLGLSSKDYQDFAGPPNITVTPGAPYQAVADLETKKPFYAVHLINICYKHVQRFKGAAVPISFAYKLPEEEVCAQSVTDPAAAGASTGPSLLDSQVNVLAGSDSGDPRDVPVSGYRTDPPPLVNAILYNRDLGKAEASNALVQVSNVGELHNVPCGNLFLALPVAHARCHGLGTELSLYYNSHQAVYQDSLEFYRRLNRVDSATLEKHWSRNPVGKGWTHSYGMTVRHYVVPLTADGRVIDHRAEVVAPDGNRIQFKQSEGDVDGLGTYLPLHECDHWQGSAELGHTLSLERRASGWTLKGLHKNWWVFDRFGILEEISDPLTRQSQTPPVRIRTQGGVTTVTDSAGRESKVFHVPVGGGLTQSDILGPDGTASVLVHHDGLLRQVSIAATQDWAFDYHAGVGQGDSCSLLKTLRDPLQHESAYDYYVGSAFRGVPEAVARDYWGRLGRVEKGIQQPRIHLWFYERYTPDRQLVVHRNPRDVEHVLELDGRRLALVSSRYVRQDRDPVTKVLRGAPRYAPASQEAAKLPLEPIASFQYHEGTKLVSRFTDLYGDATTRTYVGVPGGRKWQLESTVEPDRTTHTIQYDAASRLPWRIHTPTRTGEPTGPEPYTEFTYNTRHQVIRRKRPGLNSGGGSPVSVEESWVYDSQTGRLTEHTNASGARWIYACDPSLDPERTGQPTTQTAHMTDRERVWTTKYDKLGRPIEESEPLFGEVRETTYHPLGWVEHYRLQSIPTADGSAGRATIQLGYDAIGRMTSRADDSGSETWLPNEHGEIVVHVDRAGHRTSAEYTPSGGARTTTDGGGNVMSFDYDELDRVVRKVHPAPDPAGTPADRRSVNFAVLVDYQDDDRRIESVRRRLNGAALGPAVLKVTDRFSRGRLAGQSIERLPGGTRESVLYQYDRWGLTKLTSWYEGAFGALVKVMAQVRDDWGREVVERHVSAINGPAERGLEFSYRHDGMVVGKTQGGPSAGTTRPRTEHDYDELGRVLRTRDSYGTVVQEFSYEDFGNDPAASGAAGVVESAQDPAAGAGAGGLVIVRRLRFNRRALVTEVVTGPDAATAFRKTFRYDVSGRLVGETDADGSSMHYTLDALGRRTLIESESKVWQGGNIVRRRRPTQSVSYAWNGGVASATQDGRTAFNIYDGHGRLKRVERPGAGTSRQIEQELVYDALDRVVRRETPGDNVQAFTYEEGGRRVTARFTNYHATLRTVSRLNGQGQVLGYEIEEFSIPQGAPAQWQTPRIGLEFVYNGLGDLKSKTYVRPGMVPFARVDYDYDSYGLLASQTVVLSSQQTATSVTAERTFGYDRNMRLTEIESRIDAAARRGRNRRFGFSYNRAGYLKVLERPFWSGSDYSRYGTKTGLDHDARGRLTSIKEGILLNDPFAELALEYSRVPRPMLQVPALDLDRWELGSPAALKRATLNLKELNRTWTTIQDTAHDGEGEPESWVTTQWGPGGATKEDWRTVDESRNGSNKVRLSSRQYLRRAGAAAPIERYSYKLSTEFTAYGKVFLSRGERNASTPFDSYFGAAPSADQQGRKTHFLEMKSFDAQTHRPVTSTAVSEDPQSQEAHAVPAPQMLFKRYFHNSIGQLCGVNHMLAGRPGNAFAFDVSFSGRDSLANFSLHYHGPDGQEILQVRVHESLQGRSDLTVFVSDGMTKIAEMDFFEDSFRLYETVPGTGLRLSAQAGRFSTDPSPAGRHNHRLDAELFHHWDHRGATTYLTDQRGLIAAAFGLSNPDGETDMFGEDIAPEARPGAHSLILRNAGLSAWSFYEGAPASVDVVLGKATAAQARQAHSHLMCGDPSNPSGSRNDYGLTVFPFRYPQATTTVTRLTFQGILDELRGIGDALTAGYAGKLRMYLYDYDQDLAGVQMPSAYMAGFGVGVAMSLYFGYVAAPFGAAQAGWAIRAATFLTVASDVLSFVDAVRAIRSGKAGALDYLGLAAPISLFSVLKLQHARDARLVETMAKAANSSFTVEIVKLGQGLAKAVIRPTARMTGQIMDDLRRFGDEAFDLAEVTKGRHLTVADLTKNAGDFIQLSPAAQQALKNLDIIAPSKFSTLGEVDAVFRKLWIKLHRSRGRDLSEIAAGHRLDLGMNKIQAHFELRMFEWVMEQYGRGNYQTANTMVMNLFGFHNRSANSSVGAAITRRLMKELAPGTKVIFEIL